MEDFESRKKCKIFFGRNKEEDVGRYIKYQGGSRILLHYGRQHVTDAALLDKVRRSLDRAGMEFFELGGVQKNSRVDMVCEGIRLCEEHEINFILAIGGGSVVNSAKAIAAGACHIGLPRDLFLSGTKVSEALPLGVIATVPGSCEEFSNSATVSEKTGDGTIRIYDLRGDCLVPEFAVLNPELITSFPRHLGISCANIIVRVMESYLTNSRCVELSDRICESIMITVIQMMERLFAAPGDYEARANIMWAGALASSDVSLDREEDMAMELFEHALSSLYDCSHGQAVGMLLPAWMDFACSHDPLRLSQFAVRVMGVPLNFQDPIVTAREGIDRLRALFRRAGIPSRLEDLGGSGADIPLILDKLIPRGSQESIGVYIKLHRIDCEVILSLLQTSGNRPGSCLTRPEAVPAALQPGTALSPGRAAGDAPDKLRS